MPIVRTYACAECNHMMTVTLTMAQCDDPPPECPMCAQRPMRQEFKPVAVTGSPQTRARDLAYDIADKDYNVGNMQREPRAEGTPKVRYKDQQSGTQASNWKVTQEALSQAIASGRASRLKYGSGLDVLQQTLKTGDQPDLIEASKKRAIKVW